MTLAIWWWFGAGGKGDAADVPRKSRGRTGGDVEPANRPDADVVARIRAGDETAFEALFHQLYATLVTYAIRSVRDRAAAEDVVQTVFVELWQRRAAFDPVTGVRPYLFSAVRYRASDRRRGERRAEYYVDLYETTTAASARTPARPDQLLEQDERDVTLRAALATLAPRTQEALMLVRDHGLSYKEAAAVMGVSVNTVKTQLARAVAALRVLLGAP